MTIVLITITILSKVSRDMLCRDNYDDRSPGGGGRVGVLNKFLCGEAPPRGPTPYPNLLYTNFQEKGTTFIYLLLANCTPFTYLV